MDRHGEHVAARVEDALRAVAVVQVDVEDRDAAAGPGQPLGGDGRIVEKAEAAGEVGEGVVARRAAERVGGGRTGKHRVRGGDAVCADQ
jgi:hypothetical protein